MYVLVKTNIIIFIYTVIYYIVRTRTVTEQIQKLVKPLSLVTVHIVCGVVDPSHYFCKRVKWSCVEFCVNVNICMR